MKSVLFIAQDSYPLHGAESIVNLKLLVALSRCGEFEIDLVSKVVRGASYGANSLEELGIKLRSLHVIEVDNKLNVKTIWQHIKSLFEFGIVFKGSHWASEALPVILDLCKKNKYDYVLTKNQASVLVGLYLKRHFKLKWVATWNDPFPSSLYPKVYLDYFHEKDSWAYRKLIKVTREYVDMVVIPNSRLRDYLLPFYKIEKARTSIIPHVVNLSAGRITVTKNSLNKVLRIIHSGNISYPRDPSLLMKALSLFRLRHKDIYLQLDILGMADPTLKQQIQENGLEKVITIVPPVSYIDSLQLLDNYDVALVVEAALDEGVFLPTKVSDFMQCGKVIAAISPKIGVLNDLYKEGSIGYFADNTSVDDIINMLEILWNDFASNSLKQCHVPHNYTESYVVGKYLSF